MNVTKKQPACAQANLQEQITIASASTMVLIVLVLFYLFSIDLYAYGHLLLFWIAYSTQRKFEECFLFELASRDQGVPWYVRSISATLLGGMVYLILFPQATWWSDVYLLALFAVAHVAYTNIKIILHTLCN